MASPRLAITFPAWLTLAISLTLFGALLGLGIHNFRDENDQCDEARRMASISDIVAACLGIVAVPLGMWATWVPTRRVASVLFLLAGLPCLWFLAFATGIWSWAHHAKGDCIDDNRVQKSEWAVSIVSAGVFTVPLIWSALAGHHSSASTTTTK